jgi:hypothetical protein
MTVARQRWLQQLQRAITRVLNYWLLMGVGIIGLLVVVLDALTNIGLVENQTGAVIGVTVSFLLLYVIIERGSVLEEIRSAISGARLMIYPTRDAVYGAIPDVIEEVGRLESGEKELLLAALHGHSGKRVINPPQPVTVFQGFDTALLNAIRSSGRNMWKVRMITNITNEERLDSLMQMLVETQHADGFEMRTFSTPDAIAHLSPLVIGKEHAFLALEDPRYYRVSRGVGIQSHEAVQLVTDYFNSLWNDPRVIELRSAVGINDDQVKKLRMKIKQMAKSEPPGSTGRLE